MFDIAVIGRGLFGSAAARYLSEKNPDVAVIGPDEPENWSTHEGVFASHYDQGRITRVIDPEYVWGYLAKQSIDEYAHIEQASGIRFHYPIGCLRVDYDEQRLSEAREVGRQLGAEFEYLAARELRKRFPFLHFAGECAGLAEGGSAGYINPRSLVAAQLKIAANRGASVITETAIKIEINPLNVEVKTQEGNVYRARRVLLTPGAFANMLLERKLDLRPQAHTILLAEVPVSETRRLQEMPALIYDIPSPRAAIHSIYMLPPIQYPDGKYYIKLGGYNILEARKNTFAELRDWFRSGGDPVIADLLKDILFETMPDLRAGAFHYKPCVLAYTPHGRPFIDRVEEGRLFVATGGNGCAAKSSNEIGRIAATLVENGGWTTETDRALFAAQFQPL